MRNWIPIPFPKKSPLKPLQFRHLCLPRYNTCKCRCCRPHHQPHQVVTLTQLDMCYQASPTSASAAPKAFSQLLLLRRIIQFQILILIRLRMLLWLCLCLPLPMLPCTGFVYHHPTLIITTMIPPWTLLLLSLSLQLRLFFSPVAPVLVPSLSTL